MSIQPNQVVTINYTVKDKDGNIIDTTSNRQPFSFIYGQNQILPKLEEEIGKMLIGSKKTIELTATDAYGEYNDEATQEVNRSDFPDDAEVKEGAGFVTNTADGREVPFVIKKIEGDTVTIDFNHPLAGQSLWFEVELVNVRDATPEELSHGHVHGEGGAHQ